MRILLLLAFALAGAGLRALPAPAQAPAGGAHPPAATVAAGPPAAGRPAVAADERAVRQTITDFFEGMRRGDSAAVRRTLAPGVVFHTIGRRAGPAQLRREDVSGFLRQVGTPHPAPYDEQITFEQVLLDADLASVWTPYRFYVGRQFSHCGYNSFQLVRLAEGWRIAHVIDTRRQQPCPAAAK